MALTVATAGTGVARTSHYVTPTGASAPIQTLLLEPQRTNVALRSQELGNAAWTDVGSPIVTSNSTIAPDGTLTADTIQDDSAVAGEARRQTITIANDSTSWCGSIFVRVQSTTPTANVCLNVRLTGGTTVDAYVVVNPQTGASVTTGSALAGVERIGDYWRIYVTATNNTTGNTSLLLTAFPAFATTLTTTLDVTAQGSAVFWGAQAENAIVLSSYIKTEGTTVTRNADSLYFPFTAPPQAMTVYVRGVEKGQRYEPSSYVWQISQTNNNPRVHLNRTAGTAQVQFQTVNTAGTFTTVARPVGGDTVLGDLVEYRCILSSDGTVNLAVTLNNGSELISTPVAGTALEAAWSGQRLWVGMNGATNVGLFAFTNLIIAAGEQSRATMRSLAGVA